MLMSQIPAIPGPVEREQRGSRSVRCLPYPAGLLPTAAVDGRLLHGSVTAVGRVSLIAAIAHDRL